LQDPPVSIRSIRRLGFCSAIALFAVAAMASPRAIYALSPGTSMTFGEELRIWGSDKFKAYLTDKITMTGISVETTPRLIVTRADGSIKWKSADAVPNPLFKLFHKKTYLVMEGTGYLILYAEDWNGQKTELWRNQFDYNHNAVAGSLLTLNSFGVLCIVTQEEPARLTWWSEPW